MCLRFNRLGADCTINYKENPNYTGTVKIETKLDGVDLIFDPILASNFMMVRPEFFNFNIVKNVQCLAVDARWVVYGTMGGTLVKECSFSKIMAKRA